MHLTPTYVQNRYFERQILRKSFTLKCIWHNICTKIITLKANAQENRYLKMCLTQNMYKNITLKANAKNIIPCKMHVWHRICTKTMTLKANAKEHRYLKMHLTPHMYKIYYFEGKCQGNHHFKMHLTPSYVQNHYFEGKCSKEIVTLNFIWHQICTKLLLWRQMLKVICHFNMHLTPTYIQKLLLWRQMPRKSSL